ncbi:MAG: hypothetical protein ACP5H3_02010 [Candidatus Aenigmatarchaeota archaeon]|jgi:hypothetical protein
MNIYEILMKQLKILDLFLSRKISKEEFLDLINSEYCNCEIVDENKIPKEVLEHEKKHIEVLEKYGIKGKILKCEDIYVVSFDSSKLKNMNRSEILRFLYELHSVDSQSDYDNLVSKSVYFYILIEERNKF